MDKTFDPASVESRIAAQWEATGAFRAGLPDRAAAPPYCIVIPPPNVTGSLHMGHALNNTLQDILCRFERMRGRDVLWQPGTDHAGIATQMVVERQLMERQEPNRVTMGRDAFVQRVWDWKAESGGAIVNQLKRLGASCDWSRERFTMDEGLSRAVRKVFVELHRQGLIYKDKRLVNWDPKLRTAISDLEVETRDVKGHMWRFAYPLADGAVDGISEIIIATTRPETMLGDGAVAVHPSDERYKNLVGKMVRLPIAERLIPIIADEYPDPEFGSGAVKITGAHDFNDFEVARRHDIPLLRLMDEDARMAENVPERYLGLDRFDARKKIVEEIDAMGLLRGVEERTIPQPFGDRSGVVLEPFLTDQWYVDAKTLAQPALAAVREGRTTFIPKNWEKTYFDWLDNIQPWCISRQLWWGHQIPAWYSAWGGLYVAETEEEAIAAALADAVTREIYDDVEAGEIAQDPERWSALLTRDQDVLDTWFSSALWPFSTLGWPDETPELARFYPTTALVTGFDIIFFWVARMMMMGLHFMGEVPFRDVYIHALVRDEKGAKMSKSKGNVIDPLELIDRYGADALRFTLAAMAAQGRDIKLATSRVEGYRNFATKIWNAARFAEMNGCVRDPAFDPKAVTNAVNHWGLGELARATHDITEAIEAYRFNDAANAAYRFAWGVFCDWYLELAKPLLQAADGLDKIEARATTAFMIEAICKILHPFMPFITEEIWAKDGDRDGVLALAPWPVLEGFEAPEAEAEIGWVVDLVSSIRSVRVEMNVPQGALVPLVLTPSADTEAPSRARRWADMIGRLGRVSAIEAAETAPAQAAQFVVRGTVVALPLAGIIDIAAERTRLTKDIAKEEREVAKVDGKLNNPDFVARAPEEVIEENRERRAEAVGRIEKLRAAMGRLG